MKKFLVLFSVLFLTLVTLSEDVSISLPGDSNLTYISILEEGDSISIGDPSLEEDWDYVSGPTYAGDCGDQSYEDMDPLVDYTCNITGSVAQYEDCDDGSRREIDGTLTPFDVEITVQATLALDVSVDGESTYYAYPGETVTITAETNASELDWEGATGSGTEATFTESEPGEYTVTASYMGESQSVDIIVVGVKEIKVGDTAVSGTIYVYKGSSVTFTAIPDPDDADWPSGNPVWSGVASGTSATASVTFNTVSTSASDYKTVTVSCGESSSKSVNVVVFKVDGVFTPEDNFEGRSLDRFGLKEVVNLTAEITPSLSAATIGGLTWEKTSGLGVMDNNGNNGTARFTAGYGTGNVALKLTIQSGLSAGKGPSYNKETVKPSSGRIIKWSNIWHLYGWVSCGFKGYIYLLPTDVSFTNLKFSEGTCAATATGFFAHFNGEVHTESEDWYTVLSGNISQGCKVNATDTIYMKDWKFFWESFSVGEFTWPIPWRYRVLDDTVNHEFCIATHYVTSTETGKCTIEKAGAGPYSKEYNDPDSNY